MNLDPAQVHQFQELGYTTVDGFFEPRETAALRREVDRWVAAGRPRDVSTSSARSNLQLIPLYPHSPLYRALPFHPKVVGAVSSLIGDPVVKILDQMFLKPARTGMGTSWHTDDAYFRIADPTRGTAMWIALDDATAENGALMVVPNGHRRAWAHARDPDSDHHIRTRVDADDAVTCELSAGGVVFFCFATPHATGDNPSAKDRCGVGIHFVNLDYASAAMRDGSRWERVVLTGPAASGGRDEYGETVAGTFAAEVDRALTP